LNLAQSDGTLKLPERDNSAFLLLEKGGVFGKGRMGNAKSIVLVIDEV